MDGHSKREVLEIFNLNSKNFFLKPAANWSIVYDFHQNGQVTYHVTY